MLRAAMERGAANGPTYRIVVRGELDPRFALLFDGMDMSSASGSAATAGRSCSRRRRSLPSLFPRVMVASNDFANSLTIDNASSAHYTLQVITVVALDRDARSCCSTRAGRTTSSAHRPGGDEPAAEPVPDLRPQPEG